MPVLLIVFAWFLIGILPASTHAQDAPGPACFTGTPERAAALAKARKGSGGCGLKCKGCGCRGGPGYRNRTGRCVSYKRLRKECGPPPYLGCTAKCQPAPKDCPDKR